MKTNPSRTLRGLVLLTGLAAGLLHGAAASASVFHDPSAPVESGWHQSRGAGWFLDYGNGWIFHTDHGFMYEVPYTAEASFVWHPRSGWWWVGDAVYPFIYSLRQQGWVYYLGLDGNRLFWHIVWNEWMSGAQEENISALLELLRSLHAASEVTPEMVGELRESIRALVASSTAPSEESLQALAEAIAAAHADGVVSEEEKVVILAAFRAVLDSADFPEEDVASVRLAMIAIIDASQVDAEDIAAVKAAVQAILDEWQAGRVHPVDANPES